MRQFSRCRALRRGMLEYLKAEGIKTGRGYKRLWNDVIADVYGSMTEAKAKAIIWTFLQCDDLTAAERAELLRILQLSETALTDAQRQEIISYLQAEGDP